MANSKAKKEGNKGISSLGTGYLFAYNFAQVIGWSYVLFLLVKYYTSSRNVPLWESVKPIIVIFQNAAILEVVHILMGLVNTNIMMTVTQVVSRVSVVCGVLLATPTAPVSIGLPLLLFAWSVTEIVRYMYYALNIIDAVPYAIIWCRYTFFYALYPIGVTGELLCFYSAYTYAGDAKLWTWELPNPWNFTLQYKYILGFAMMTYIPLFPRLYLYMIAQRKKIIGGSAAKKKN